MQAHGIFKQEQTEDLIIKTNLPEKLYDHFAAVDLISKRSLSYSLGQAEKIEFGLSLTKTSIKNREYNVVRVTILRTTDLHAESSQEKYQPLSTSEIYDFILKNAYYSGFINVEGMDFPGEVNYYALIGSNNLFSRAETNKFIDEITTALAQTAPGLVQAPDKQHGGCSLM
jgi:hypothetical protein